MNEHIKVTDEQYLYSGLSLIAEIGGYVGLFLGVSVNQIIDLADVLITKIGGLTYFKMIEIYIPMLFAT